MNPFLQTLVTFNLVRITERLANEFNEDNTEFDTDVFEYGGKVPSSLAYVDDGELIQTPDEFFLLIWRILYIIKICYFASECRYRIIIHKANFRNNRMCGLFLFFRW